MEKMTWLVVIVVSIIIGASILIAVVTALILSNKADRERQELLAKISSSQATTLASSYAE